MCPPSLDADQKWRVFLKSLPTREKDENGLPKGLEDPEIYGPDGNKSMASKTTSVFQSDSNTSPLLELDQTSPTQTLSSDNSLNDIYKSAKNLRIIEQNYSSSKRL